MSANAEYRWALKAFERGEITAADLADAEASARYEAECDEREYDYDTETNDYEVY